MDMTTTQTQDQVTIPVGEFEVRAIDEGVVAQLRVTDDAGNAPRVIVNPEGDTPPLRCCLELADHAAAGRMLSGLFADPEVAVVHARALEFGCFTFEVRRAAV